MWKPLWWLAWLYTHYWGALWDWRNALGSVHYGFEDFYKWVTTQIEHYIRVRGVYFGHSPDLVAWFSAMWLQASSALAKPFFVWNWHYCVEYFSGLNSNINYPYDSSDKLRFVSSWYRSKQRVATSFHMILWELNMWELCTDTVKVWHWKQLALEDINRNEFSSKDLS